MSERDTPAPEAVLGSFHGDDEFPIEWDEGETRALLDLRRPPLPEPGVADVLRHRRLVADLRPHVPPLRHAVRVATGSRRTINGYVYTAADPGRRRRCRPRRREYEARYVAARAARPGYAGADRRLPRLRPAALRRELPRLVARPAAARDRAQLRVPRRLRHGVARASSSSPCCSRTRSTSTTATGRSTGCSTSPSSRRRSG